MRTVCVRMAKSKAPKAPVARPLKRSRSRVAHPVTLSLDIGVRRAGEELAAAAGLPLSRYIELLIRAKLEAA